MIRLIRGAAENEAKTIWWWEDGYVLASICQAQDVFAPNASCVFAEPANREAPYLAEQIWAVVNELA